MARTRGRPPSDDPKDRVLQTRVPKGLYEDLVTQARRLRVPVSNLVRNILEDSVRMVENIVDSGLDIAEAFAKSPGAFDPSVVAGWQPMVANRRLVCANCRKPIKKGEDAFLSVGEPGGRVHTICRSCQCEI
ncbi:MAG: BrnA antitoxin family protein [Deltaproteobacteria bacterium]|nr:BrnA antitoxin family protein [Deltaproteobacteria bacterium]